MPADLVLLPMEEFDIILGMDWLVKHDATIHCKQHRVSVMKSGQQRWFIPCHKDTQPQTIQLQDHGGAVEYLIVMSMVVGLIDKVNLEEVEIVKDFVDVFPERLGYRHLGKQN